MYVYQYIYIYIVCIYIYKYCMYIYIYIFMYCVCVCPVPEHISSDLSCGHHSSGTRVPSFCWNSCCRFEAARSLAWNAASTLPDSTHVETVGVLLEIFGCVKFIHFKFWSQGVVWTAMSTQRMSLDSRSTIERTSPWCGLGLLTSIKLTEFWRACFLILSL